MNFGSSSKDGDGVLSDRIKAAWVGKTDLSTRRRRVFVAEVLNSGEEPLVAFASKGSGPSALTVALTCNEVVVVDFSSIQFRSQVEDLEARVDGGTVTLLDTKGDTQSFAPSSKEALHRFMDVLRSLQSQEPARENQLPAFVLVADGIDLRVEQVVGLILSREGCEVVDSQNRTVVALQASEIRGLAISGPGAQTEGGGFGWFASDFQSAIKMELITSWLNRVTTRTTITTFVRIDSENWTLSLVTEHATPEQLLLRAPLIEPRPTRFVGGQAQPTDLSAQLKSLAELYQQGLLDHDEFSAAKQRLLGANDD